MQKTKQFDQEAQHKKGSQSCFCATRGIFCQIKWAITSKIFLWEHHDKMYKNGTTNFLSINFDERIYYYE